MAEVFLARRWGHNGIEHDVVVKRLRDDVVGLPSVQEMFAWEGWISSRLGHPNIVTFHDYVPHHGRDHLVFEHIRGPDLAVMMRALRRAGAVFPLRAILEIGMAVARALTHVHNLADEEGRPLGLVHRDVSPQNILVSVDGQVKLIDFGVAKTTSTHVPRQTQPTLVKGKMGYIAPEHIRGQTIDARSDLYALGAVLFELLTNAPLLPRSDDMDMIRATLLMEVPLIAPLRPNCPPSLEVLIRRVLSKNPDHRFENAEKMERALADAAQGLPEEVGAPTLREIALSVHAEPETNRLLEKLPNLPRIDRLSTSHEARKTADLAEANTRPEGYPESPNEPNNPFVEASLGTSNASLVIARSTASRVRTSGPSSGFGRTISLTLAFIVGVIFAAAVFDLVRRKMSFPLEMTPSSATHGASSNDAPEHPRSSHRSVE